MIDRDRGESESGRQRFDFKRYIPVALRAQDKTVRIQLTHQHCSIVIVYFVLATTCYPVRSSFLFNEKNSYDHNVFTGKIYYH